MKLKKEYLIIFLIQVTEVLGFSLILPFLPLFAQDMGASPIVIGLLLTTFSFFQFLTSPILGKLSDHYGRKPLLIFSQISTFLSFIILGFSNTLWMIFISRIVDGLLGSNFTIAQAYLSDISSKKDRSKVFGISGAAFGVGFLIGPGIGGYLANLTSMGYSLPSFIAAFISLITIFITAVFLKETVKRKKDVKLDLKIFHFNEFKKYFSNKKISPRLWLFFSYLISHMIFTSQFALYSERQLGFGVREIGFMLTYVGLGEKKLQYIGIICMILGMIGAAFVTHWIPFLFIMGLFAFGSGVNRPIMVGGISRKVSGKEQGALLGVTTSLGSLSQIISPLIGGFMITYFWPGSLPLMGAAAMFIGLLFRINISKRNAHL